MVVVRRRRTWLLVLGALAVVAGAFAIARRHHPHEPVAAPVAERDIVVSKQRASISAADVAQNQATGKLRLEGQVIDEQDQPVAGADVYTRRGAHHVVTETDGSFAFDGLTADLWGVDARKGPLGGRGEVRLSARSEPVIVHMRLGVTLVVHVMDEHAPLEGATIRLDDELGVTADHNGTATIAGVVDNLHFLEVSASGHSPVSLTIATGDDPGGTIERTVNLRRGTPVSGSVVGPDGKPVTDAGVELELRGERTPIRSKSDAMGAWHVDAIAAGTYRVSATSEIYGPAPDLQVELDGLTPRRDLVVHVAYDAQLVGTIVDVNGKPVADARVNAELEPQSFTVRSGPNGRFAMLGIPAGTYAVNAASSHGGSVTSRATVHNDERVDVKVVLEDTGIAGTVVDSSGEPIAEAHVDAVAEPMLPRSNGFGTDVTDSHGHFEIGGLEPGDYRVAATWAGQPQRDFGAGQHVHSGTHDLKIELQAPATLTGRVLLDGVPMTSYVVLVSDRPDRGIGSPTNVHAADGRFAIKGIAPGKWGAVVIGPGTARKVIPAVTIEAGKPTDFGDIAMAHGQRISGHVRDATGAPVSGASVTIGQGFNMPDRDVASLVLQGDAEATTDASGAYHFDGVEPRLFGGRPSQISATAPNVGTSLPIPVPDGDATIDLSLVATGGIDGVVKGSTGQGTVFANPTGDPNRPRTAMVERDGTFSLDNLLPGDYTVKLFGIGAVTAPAVTVTVEATRRSTVTLVVPNGSVTLIVKATGDPCKLVVLAPAGDGPPKPTDVTGSALCANNTAVLDNVSPGNYRVCVNGPFCTPVTVAATPDHQTVEAHVGSGR
jgi:protocatechuate 3,4-dioxygenase beta subunit